LHFNWLLEVEPTELLMALTGHQQKTMEHICICIKCIEIDADCYCHWQPQPV